MEGKTIRLATLGCSPKTELREQPWATNPGLQKLRAIVLPGTGGMPKKRNPTLCAAVWHMHGVGEMACT